MVRTGILIALTAVVVLGCGAPWAPSERPGWSFGARQLRIDIENRRDIPITLLVAREDLAGMGPLVGTVEPSVIEPGMTRTVLVSVPAGLGWGLYIVPGATDVAILSGATVAGRSGHLPMTIEVRPGGLVQTRLPDPAHT